MTRMPPDPRTRSAGAVTLGLLAGGQGTRLGGTDKAWLLLGGQPQALRLARRLHAEVGQVLVSSNSPPASFVPLGLRVVADRVAGLGPLGGLDALAHACTTPWLLTLPVDVVSVNDCLLRSLRAAGDKGAWAEDAAGPQPLVALWPVEALREAAAQAIAAGERAIHALQARLRMPGVRFDGVRFGNLNTPADLAAAGARLPEPRGGQE